ncbi:insulinase family protein [bacterium]|nr:insulinase family protein [candidate division CSSED10-310 bacterium]
MNQSFFLRILAVMTLVAWPVFGVRAGMDLPVSELSLSNGMTVLAVERPDAPVIAFALYYRVGSVDETPGKTGIAHYCEHMMFKSTDHLKGEAFAQLMGTIGGGLSNANTSFDRTCYYETVAPDRLEFVIRLEAERMAHLHPTIEESLSELEVVKEELRQGYIDNPSGRIRFDLYQQAFEHHPYKTLTIGHLTDVASITYDDLMAFQRRFYVPVNAVAVVVGRFDTKHLLHLMETHFGSVPGGAPVVRRFPAEPSQSVERRFELDMPVQHGMLWTGYHVPEAAHRDNLVLRVLSTVLSRGGSSPLGRLSQGRNPVAMTAYSWVRESMEPGLMIITGIPMPGIDPEILEDRIDEEIQRIQQDGITEDQLVTARTQLLAQEVYLMQSCMGIAMRLGEAEMVSTWRDALTLADDLASITRNEIRDAARKYLVTTNRTVGIARVPTPAPIPGEDAVPLEKNERNAHAEESE